jgi:hypothetical protein
MFFKQDHPPQSALIPKFGLFCNNPSIPAQKHGVSPIVFGTLRVTLRYGADTDQRNSPKSLKKNVFIYIYMTMLHK